MLGKCSFTIPKWLLRDEMRWAKWTEKVNGLSYCHLYYVYCTVLSNIGGFTYYAIYLEMSRLKELAGKNKFMWQDFYFTWVCASKVNRNLM